MSLDLIIWKTPAVTTEEEASSVVARFRESDDLRVYRASEDVLRFYDEVLQRHPALESVIDDESRRVQSPWSVTPDRSDRVIELNMRWGTPDATLDAIVDLARKYDLVLYDPQGPDLHSPEREAEPADVAGQSSRTRKASWDRLATSNAQTLPVFARHGSMGACTGVYAPMFAFRLGD